MAEVPKPPSILNALEFGIHAAGSREISWVFVARCRWERSQSCSRHVQIAPGSRTANTAVTMGAMLDQR